MAELQRTWGEARSSIVDGIEQFKSTGRLDRKRASDLRLVERAVRADSTATLASAPSAATG